MSTVPPQSGADRPADLPAPTPLPPVVDSPLGILADATPAPVPKAAKKVVRKVVKKVAKKSGAAPARPARPTGRTRAVDPVDALLDGRAVPPPTRTLGSDAQASIKGLVIIGLALLMGFVLLSAGYQREGTLVAGRPVQVAESTTSTASPFATTTSVPPTTAPTVTLKKPSEITVQVANGAPKQLTGTPAGDATRKFSAAGYKIRSAVDAPDVPATIVYYAENLKGEAEEAAKVLKIAPNKVAPMPSPIPTFAQGAQILIELGPDYSPTAG